MVDWLMNGLVSWLAEKVTDLLGGLLAFLASSIFVSPDVTVLPQVTSIAGKSAVVVNACFILAIIAVGVAAMVGDSVEMRYGIKELIPRLVVGFVLSAFAVPLTGVLIDIANALTVSLTGTSAPTTEAVTFVQDRLASAMTDKNSALLMAIIGLLIVVLMFMLVGTWLVRIGVLVVLAGIAPVALACYATPWTQGAAQLWWRTLLGCLATPALQAIAFSAGINLLIDPKSNLPILLGLPGSDTVNLMLVIVVLWVTIKIPGMVRRYASRAGSPSAGGVLLRAVVIQGVTAPGSPSCSAVVSSCRTASPSTPPVKFTSERPQRRSRRRTTSSSAIRWSCSAGPRPISRSTACSCSPHSCGMSPTRPPVRSMSKSLPSL